MRGLIAICIIVSGLFGCTEDGKANSGQAQPGQEMLMDKEQFINDILNIINEGWKGNRIDSHGRSWPYPTADIGTIGRDIDSYCRRIKRDEAMQKATEPVSQVWHTTRGPISIEVDKVIAEQRRRKERQS